MQWLLHGSLTPAVADALARHGHKTHSPVELGLPPESAAPEILKAAGEKQWEILTTDAALSTAPFHQEQWFKRAIVYLQLEGGEVEQDDAIDRLFARYKRLNGGRLYTVTATRVKIRQLPGG